MATSIVPLTGESRDHLEIVLPAASTGKLDALRHYLSVEPRFLDLVGPHGRTLLWEAARKGRLEVVRELAERGAKLDPLGCYFRETMVEVTPWCIATLRKKRKVADFLEERGAGRDASADLFFGERERLEATLAKDPEALDRPFVREHRWHPYEARPLHYLIAGGHTRLAREWIERGVDVKRDGETFFAWALGKGDPELVRALLEGGAQPRPGDVAEAILEPEWSDLLQEFGYELDVNAPDRQGFPPLVEACRGNHNSPDDPERVRRWLERGARVDVRDHKQKTALHRASQANFTATIELLLAEGAPIDARDEKGETPLFDAVRAGRLEAVQLLLERGADRRIENRLGQSAATLAGRLKKPAAAAIRERLGS